MIQRTYSLLAGMGLAFLTLTGAHAQALCGSYPIDARSEYCYKGYRPIPLGLEICEDAQGVVTQYDLRVARCQEGLVVRNDHSLCLSQGGRAVPFDPKDKYCFMGQVTQHNNKFCVSPNGSMFVLEPGNTRCNGAIRP